jgi:hypothetical protein
MASNLLRLIEQLGARTPQEREVLLPLFATAILRAGPEGAQLPKDIASIVSAFWQSVERQTPEATAAAVEQRLSEAGITNATFRELALAAGHSDPAKGLMTRFEPRATPKAGQTRAHPLARFALLERGPPRDGGKGG